jgi:hypothetical protein
MVDIIQRFLDWFSANVDTLTKIGAALVVVVGSLWQAYLHFYGKAKQEPTVPASSPIPGNIKIEVAPSSALPPTIQRPPLIAIEGRYRFSTNEDRWSILFGCAFSTFWCFALFLGVGSTLRTLDLQFPLILFDLLFYSFAILGLYLGVAVLLSLVTLLTGKARV